MKKFLSIVLALTMVFAMGVLAFADDPVTGTIVVENAKDDGIYNAYKIFSVEYLTVQDGEGNNVLSYLYTIADGSKWKTAVTAYAADSSKGLELTAFNDVLKVDFTDDFSAADFAAYLKENIPTDAPVTNLPVANGTATATGLDLGYYFVTSSVGVFAALSTTNPTATIIEKNPFDFDKTEEKTSYDLGEKVEYTISATIPSTKGIDDYKYIITDTMTEGLDFNNDVVVEVYENEENGARIAGLSAGEHTYTVNFNATNKQYFEIDFNITDDVMQQYAGKKLVITYTATLNEKAVAVISVNKATLKYGHEDDLQTAYDDVVLYSSKIVINKYEKGKEDVKLAGAEFILYKDDNGTTKYYKLVDNKVVWVTSEADATIFKTADSEDAAGESAVEKGTATINGLANGTYYLKETKAPAGYALLNDPIEVPLNGIATINENTNTSAGGEYTNGEGSFSVNTGDLISTKDIENAKGSVILPSTGGIGTTIFYIVGALLVVGAVVIIIARKRVGAAEE